MCLNNLTGINKLAFNTSVSLGFGGVGYLLTKAVTLIKPTANAYINPTIGFVAPAAMAGTMLGLLSIDWASHKTDNSAAIPLALVAAAFVPFAIGAALKIPFKAILITASLTVLPIVLFAWNVYRSAGRDPFEN